MTKVVAFIIITIIIIIKEIIGAFIFIIDYKYFIIYSISHLHAPQRFPTCF